jgi:membrane-bound lytic murein transglycosylase D
MRHAWWLPLVGTLLAGFSLGDGAASTNAAQPHAVALCGPESAALRGLADDEGDGEGVDTAIRGRAGPVEVCGPAEDRRFCPSDDARALWLAGLRAPDLPVRATPRVEGFFRYLTESPRGRRVFREWLTEGAPYRDTVQATLRNDGLPEDLDAIAFVESGYCPTAESREGAAGLWQLMPATARAYGLAVTPAYDERRSLEKATGVAAHYLRDLRERFGSWELALAAYDMGYGRLLRRMRALSTNDYWALSRTQGVLPGETVRYVPEIEATALVLRNLDRFGFADPDRPAPAAVSDLEVPAGTSLALLARASGTSVVRLRELNPEWLAGTAPGDVAGGVTIHVPSRGVGRAEVMLPRLLARERPDPLEGRVGEAFDWGGDELGPAPASPADGGALTVYHRVAAGDTLESVASVFGEDPLEIVARNHLDPDAKLQTGMLIEVRVRDAATR